MTDMAQSSKVGHEDGQQLTFATRGVVSPVATELVRAHAFAAVAALLVSSLFGTIVAIKLVYPEFLDGQAWSTWGSLRASHTQGIQGRVADWRYNLLPVFSDLLPSDPEMQATLDRVRAPYLARLREPIAENHELLYRRGNFNGSWDQLIVEALMKVMDAEIAFSPSFRWGTTLLPGQTITRENLMEQTAITYPDASVGAMTGADIHKRLETLSDKLFNDDPYQHQGATWCAPAG